MIKITLILILALCGTYHALPGTPNFSRHLPSIPHKPECAAIAHNFNILNLVPELQDACARLISEGDHTVALRCGDSKYPYCDSEDSRCKALGGVSGEVKWEYSLPVKSAQETDSTNFRWVGDAKKCKPANNRIPAVPTCAVGSDG